MKLLCLLALSGLVSFNVSAKDDQRIIYGNDDRQDVINVGDNLMIEKARSTAGMFNPSSFISQADGSYEVKGNTLVQRGWCSSERFSNQITAPTCTGFLIAPDVIVTAGHCVAKKSDCTNFVWAFDFKISSNTENRIFLPKNNVYKCKSIISTVNSSITKNDYAVIRLDRKVTDRPALEYRKSGKISNSASLVLIGHPKGLPMKIAGGAVVRSNSASNYFVTNTDSYAGNSGSPVFDAVTGVVEGILVRGDSDSVTTSENCSISKVCTDTGCRGEDVTRITNIPTI